MSDVNERLTRWAAVGQQIGRAREAQRPRRTKRAAARAAGISEAHWRHIEAGKRIVSGTALPPAVSPQALEDAAASVGLDPEPLFRELGWEYSPTRPEAQAPPGISDRIARLETDMRGISDAVTALTADVGRVLRRLDPEPASDQ